MGTIGRLDVQKREEADAADRLRETLNRYTKEPA